MKFEHKSAPLLSKREFRSRVLKSACLAGGLIAFSLGLGVAGYHGFAELSWVDSILNASMILTGMGPVNPLPNSVAKLFASAYAIFSGVIFLTSVAVLFSPVYHRFLHHFHLEMDDGNDSADNH